MQISGNVFSITGGKNAKVTKHPFPKLIYLEEIGKIYLIWSSLVLHSKAITFKLPPNVK
jgi:hypothetical protein